MQGAHNFVMRAPIFYVAQTVSPVTTALTTEILIRCFVKIVFHEHVSRGQDDALVVPGPPLANTLFSPSSTPATPPARKRCPPSKYRLMGYIPRPPNAFILFRADFVTQKHDPGSMETDHGSLSKIIGLFAIFSLSYLIASHLASPQATAGAPYPSKRNTSGKSAQSTQKHTTRSLRD